MTHEIRHDETAPLSFLPPGARPEPPISIEAILAAVFAALVLLAILFDAAWLGAHKHVVCAKWLAKGQADCAGSDGFREWGPMAIGQGLGLLLLELVLIPAGVYLTGRIIRHTRRQPGALPG